MQSSNASEMFRAMLSAVHVHRYERTTTDAVTAMPKTTVEARPGCVFELRNPQYNLIDCLSIDLRWAAANTLHFFADTEEAGCLPRYNAVAYKFLTAEQWLGAYGAIAMPGIDQCIALLQASPHTRKAVVQMNGCEEVDINRPACWSHLHFMRGRYGLDLLVYQRSCNLLTVMPYDLVLLTNILAYVAQALQCGIGSLHWSFGSLHHVKGADVRPVDGQRNVGLSVPRVSRNVAWDMLLHPESYSCSIGKLLQQEGEVRS